VVLTSPSLTLLNYNIHNSYNGYDGYDGHNGYDSTIAINALTKPVGTLLTIAINNATHTNLLN
jgi:hypothetical protein